MRNAVIRKKRLAEERALEAYLRMPQRLIVPHFEMHLSQTAEDAKSWHERVHALALEGPYWNV